MSEKNLSEKLNGVWFLEHFIDKRDDGSIVHTLGPEARGYIAYTPEGWVSVQIMGSNRMPYNNADINGGTMEQLAAASESYFAYSGRYETDDSRQTVTHFLKFALIPNWVGTKQLRHVSFSEDGNFLTLQSDPMIFDGEVHHPELLWRKLTD
ncbi:lipocalin-like domain-containing protein [Deltaproteobacteria bacterium OttesenSCG-928-M10]|nr:lipocalin-like domain-containing protein [Deltaproteobacteria bacterium OttesenSCG-928-M10]